MLNTKERPFIKERQMLFTGLKKHMSAQKLSQFENQKLRRIPYQKDKQIEFSNISQQR